MMKRMWVACVGLAVAMGAFAADKPSPPTMLDDWALESDIAKLKQQFDAVFEVLENENYAAIANEDVSAWSCGKQAGHIALVADLVATAVLSNLENPDQNADAEWAGPAEAVLTAGHFPRGVAEAPQSVRPEEKSREELLKVAKETKEKWDKILARQDELAANEARAPHPAFGMLTSSDWVRFVTIHNAHHLRIIRDILKASDKTDAGFGADVLEDVPEPWN